MKAAAMLSVTIHEGRVRVHIPWNMQAMFRACEKQVRSLSKGQRLQREFRVCDAEQVIADWQTAAASRPPQRQRLPSNLVIENPRQHISVFYLYMTRRGFPMNASGITDKLIYNRFV